MIKLSFSPLKTGMAALLLTVGMSFQASALPVSPANPVAPVSAAQAPAAAIPVKDGPRQYAPGDPRGEYRGRYWRDCDSWRCRDYRRRPHFRGSGVYLGLGIAPAYRLYNEPRRIYRPQRLGSAHVRWCYDRYRSYRAYDNTFQPYNGPRRQCWSPYS